MKKTSISKLKKDQVKPQNLSNITITCPAIPDDSPKALNSREILMFALRLKGLDFRDSLYYLCPREKNNAYADKDDVLKEPDPETLNELRRFKSITSRGFYPIYIDGEAEYGLFGRALINLERGNLICEYSGDVVINRDYLFTKSDDTFTLLTTGSSKNSLDVIPLKHGNMGRFLNSVSPENKDIKQNVILILISIIFNCILYSHFPFCLINYWFYRRYL